jgi:hypothetical protein
VEERHFSEEFSFHVEESTQYSGSQIFADNCQKGLYTILCYSSSYLVWFGHSGAIALLDCCNTNNNNHNRGFVTSCSSYENDTGFDGKTFFTGEANFTVKELEVFELIE